MLTKGVIEDIVMLHLSRTRPGGAGQVVKKVPELKKKVFISDWELKRRLSPDHKTVAVPADAIISPLSLDWLEYEGVKIVRGK